jgi:hypothetical protein
MTPEFNSGAAHEAYAPLHWDAEEWDFRACSEDDESLTDGEYLQFLLDGELKDEDDDESWDGYDSSSEEEEGYESTEEDPMMKTEMTTGTPMTEPIVMMAPPMTTALEMMAAMGAAVTAMSAQVLRSNVVGS